MQQPGPMFQVTPSFPSTNITTEQIQKISAICNPHRQSPLPCATYQPFSVNFFMASGEPSLCSQCGHRILKHLIKPFQILDSFAKCTRLKRFSSSILNAVKREHHECWYKQNVVQYARRFKTGCELRYSPSSGGHFYFSEPRRSGSDYLDENKKLILAILDNQNLGKLAECAQYQAQLQKNLMYLAAIADAQPQTLSPSMPPPMTPNNVLQQGGLYLPHPQAAGMAQQPGTFAQRAPFSTPHPMQDPRHQLPQQVHPQSTQGLMAMWPVGATNGTNPMHKNANLGGFNSSLPALNPGNNPDKPESGATPKSNVQ